jgi:hypothetical protein
MFTPTSTWDWATGEEHRTPATRTAQASKLNLNMIFPRFIQSFNLDNLGPA